jgi:hypothetical protein
VLIVKCRATRPCSDARALGMRPPVAYCHFGLGTLWRRTGDRVKADKHLVRASKMCREMDMTFWLARAEAVLGSRALRDLLR